jgi:SH3 domain protein
LEKRYKALENKLDELREENKTQKEENKNLNLALEQKENVLAQVTDSYEALRTESTEFLNLKSNYKKLSTELNEQSRRAREFEEALTKLQKRQIFRWVLTGAGILLVGFLIGMSSRRQRRRSSLL